MQRKSLKRLTNYIENEGFSIDSRGAGVQDGFMSILSQHIVIVTGKGGVGKSTVAAAMATKAAADGKKVLLVEFGEESFLGPFLDVSHLSITPQPVKDLGFEVAIWDTETCLREYVLHFIKIQS
jgi:anion-transporting  ArsA/GET3 family ATPase